MTRSSALRDDNQRPSDHRKRFDADEQSNKGYPSSRRHDCDRNIYALRGFDNPDRPVRRTFGPRGPSTRPTRGRLGTRSTNPDIVIATDKCETANVASYWSAAEMRQAEYFSAILDEQHAQIVREIAYVSAALAHCQDTDDTSGVRRLRRRLAHKHREEFELDRLREGLHRRFTAGINKQAKAIRYFEIVITRRRSCWRVQIPELDVVLTNIHRRADAEIMGQAYIAVITGTPMAEIAVCVRPTRPSRGPVRH
jgi:hypothetical protein